MLRQEELAFIKVISTLQLSPAILKDLRMALSRRKQPVVPAGSRSTTSGSGARVPQRPPSQLGGKRKANELASSGDSAEPANRRPAPDAGSAPLPTISKVTGEQATDGSRQLVPLERGVTYAAVLAVSVSPFQPSGSFKPTAIGSDQSEPAVSPETANRRKSSDMSGHLSDMRMAQLRAPMWPTPAYQQEISQIRPQFLFQV